MARSYSTDTYISIAELISELPPAYILTYLAEEMGESLDSDLVRKTLVPLLDHEDRVVREGAILGLKNHIDAAVRLKLTHIEENDISPAVRDTAMDALANWNGGV